MAQVKFYKSGNLWIYTDGRTDAEKTAPAGEYRRIVDESENKVGIVGKDNNLYLFLDKTIEVTDIQKSDTADDNYTSLADFFTATDEFFLAQAALGYSSEYGSRSTSNQNPDSANRTCSEPLVSETNLAANTYFSSFTIDNFKETFIHLFATDATGATFKVYWTGDPDATVPAAGGSAGATWKEITTDIFGGAVTGTSINEAAQFKGVPDRFLVEYTTQNATNVVNVWIKRHY